VLSQPAPPPAVAPSVTPQPAPPPATASTAPRESAGSVNAAVPLAPRPTIDTGPLMARGQALLREGDVAGARLFFERAAETGDGAAMSALGRTYDPIELRQLGVLGIKADPNRALQWYRSAATAGDSTAQQSIGRLSEWIARTR
jgi:TPR repeat protein